MSGIHGQVLGHIVRRGVQALKPDESVQNLAGTSVESTPAFTYFNDLPVWAWALYGFTAVVFYFLFVSVRSLRQADGEAARAARTGIY